MNTVGSECKWCEQPITRLERTWTALTAAGEFKSDWVNPFGFPWCPGDGELKPHVPMSV